MFYLYSLERRSKGLSGIFLVALILFLNACEVDIEDPPNHNEMNATIVLSAGAPVNFSANNSNAEMGNSWLSGTFVSGTNASNAKIYLNIYDYTRPAFGRTGPGTYVFDCKYLPNSDDPYSPNYLHSYLDPGTVTITVSDDHNLQGYFNTVVCRTGVDSVRISGTFKGDHLSF